MTSTEIGHSGLSCPYCGSESSMIKDGRSHMGEYFRRRRECICGRRFTTYEITKEEYESLKNYKRMLHDVMMMKGK